MTGIEILSPAGSIEGLYGALKNDADAVYIGTTKFGARAFADNPSTDEIEQALAYAHQRDKKIYLTVNTLLTDSELENELYDMILPLYKAGLDACIVQDLGVLSFLHKFFPDMDLHASTQMTLFSGEEANLFKKYGVTRFVPARELTIGEIVKAKEQTDMEIEVFVHGALCYCYSGQCLMSQVIGGRSGNRGMCAQPCRLPFEVDGKRGYFLNTKDIATVFNIPDLVDAGIDSFKIEGRMKKKEYSAYLAHIYRKYVDVYLANGRESFDELVANKDSKLWNDYKKLQDLYNRGGFSNSFLFEKDKKNLIYKKKNNHMGSLVGKVIDSKKNSATIQLCENVYAQDILVFRNSKDEDLYEFTVKDDVKEKNLTTNVLKGSNIKNGDLVYRTRNANLLAQIDKQIEADNDKKMLDGEVTCELGKPVMLCIKSDKKQVVVYGDIAEQAKNKPIDDKAVRKPISQLGNTHYMWNSLKVNVDGELFLSNASLKKLRREGIKKLEKEPERKVVSYEKEEFSQTKNNKDIYVSVSNAKQLEFVAKNVKKDFVIHIKLDDFSRSDWENSVKFLQQKRVSISLPQVIRNRQFELDLSGVNIESFIVNSHAMYLYCIKNYESIKMIANDNFYMKNNRAVNAYLSYGIEPGVDIVYGRKQVMVTEHCIENSAFGCTKSKTKRTIKTPKNDSFIVVNHCNYCYNTIYTKEPQINLQGKSVGRIDFTTENETEMRKVLNQWKLL